MDQVDFSIPFGADDDLKTLEDQLFWDEELVDEEFKEPEPVEECSNYASFNKNSVQLFVQEFRNKVGHTPSKPSGRAFFDSHDYLVN
jgi:hypothetical protein